ncbi:MAG: hypothetical protein IKD78_09010 [Bacteroidales bacterium]|nr:hypothetical protein [Bacteroidales bacterium]
MKNDNEPNTIKQSCFHHYAIDNNGEITSIETIQIENRHNGYYCVSCGGAMIPVLGKIREHHFRHKTDTCSYESYIHKLWKQYIFEQWQKLSHLYVTYYVEYCCDKTKTCKLFAASKTLRCKGTFEKETIDLKEKYDTCEIEGVYGGYRADLLLSNSHNPDIVPTFVEICYKHPCDEQKQHAGIPIIELKVTDDNLHLPQRLTERPTLIPGFDKHPIDNYGIVLYGFDRKKQLGHNVRRFYIYQDENGINHGKVDDTILLCHSLDEHLPDSMLEVVVTEDNARNDSLLFEFGIRTAAKNGIKIRHCYYCRYHGNRGTTCRLHMDGNKGSWVVNINDFSDVEFDKTNYTFGCRWYYEWPIRSRVNAEEIPHIIWKNNKYAMKTVKVPANIIAKVNITEQRLNEIALQHIQPK